MKKKQKVDWGAYAFLIPAGILYLSVIIAPVCYSLFISLFKWNGIGDMEFVGISNYLHLFTEAPIFITNKK